MRAEFSVPLQAQASRMELQNQVAIGWSVSPLEDSMTALLIIALLTWFGAIVWMAWSTSKDK